LREAGIVRARFYVQPVDAGRSVIRGIAERDGTEKPHAILRRLDDVLEALRRRLEAA
jgi:hypothetical protein